MEYETARRAVAALDREAVANARWFAGKERDLGEIAFVDAIAPADARGSVLAIVSIADQLYSLPFGSDGAEAGPGDPLWPALARMAGAAEAHVTGAGRWLDPDQSHTSVVLGERLVLKLYRRLNPGRNPEVEILAGLDVPEVPAFRGAVKHLLPGGAEVILCLLQDLIPGVESGWDAYIDRLVALAIDPARLKAALDDAASLGAATGRLHVALAERLGTSRLDPMVLSTRRARAEALLEEALRLLDSSAASQLQRAAPRIREDLGFYGTGGGARAHRLHGDLHLAQFLRLTDGSLAVVDFEGEPGRALDERLAAWTPMWDLATLQLSFENAAAAARRRLEAPARDEAPLDTWVASAGAYASAAYASATGRPVDDGLLRASAAEKQVTELLYAARQLPEWLYAPLEVLERRWG